MCCKVMERQPLHSDVATAQPMEEQASARWGAWDPKHEKLSVLQVFLFPRGATPYCGGTRVALWGDLRRRWGARRDFPSLSAEPASWRVQTLVGLPTDVFIRSVLLPHGGTPSAVPWVRAMVGILFVEQRLFWSQGGAWSKALGYAPYLAKAPAWMKEIWSIL